VKKAYADKLKDPRWQRRRLQILQKSDFSCMKCDAEDQTLHVHHLIYEKGKEPWEYSDELLVPLCDQCHKEVAETQLNISRLLAHFPVEFLDQLNDAIVDIVTAPDHPFEAWSKWIKSAHDIYKSQVKRLAA
jgi:5-methylcytosine-specific restriction endonuclease McrA